MAQISTLMFLFVSLLPATLWAKADGTPATTKTAPVPRKIARYAGRLISHYDTDGNGTLNAAEWASMQGQPADIDRDQNGQITSTEMVFHISTYARSRRLGLAGLSNSENAGSNRGSEAGPNKQATTGETSSVVNIDTAARQADTKFHVPVKSRLNQLPGWFSQRDQNGDGQLSLAEFSPTRSRESVKAFQKLDANRDGLVTPQESVRPKQELRRAAEENLPVSGAAQAAR